MNECKKEKRGGICFYNCDNIEFMKTKPDNYYDLAIVDPEYGIGAGSKNFINGNRKKDNDTHRKNDWDKNPPPPEYFEQLFRVSKNQIIWGGNYFDLPPTRCFLIFDKTIHGNSYADCELAWTSFDKVARIFAVNMVEVTKDGRIHATQKPVKLYRWVLKNYAEKSFKILDTHGGSMSIAKAADLEGFDIDICEIDKKYFTDGVSAFDYHKRQLKLF